MTINKLYIRRPRVRTIIIVAFALFALCRCDDAAAQTADSARTWKYGGTAVTLSGDTLRVSGKGKMANYVSGSPWRLEFATCAIIEDGVTHIGGKAFMFMSGLKSVTIPNSVVAIEEKAFKETGLTSIEIPASVKSIFSEDAFSGCADLASINVVPDNTEYSSEDGVLFNKDKTVLLLYPMGKNGAYTIPSSVKNIYERAFAYNLNLKSVIIPGNVKSIGRFAFVGCDSLTSLTIEDGVESIESDAFWRCGGLKHITIPRSVTSILSDAFGRCANLMSITVADDNPNYSSEDGVLFSKNKDVLIQYPEGRFNTYYTFPDTAYYKAIAMSVLTALILFAVIFVIIKRTPKSFGHRWAFFIVTITALSAVALFASYTYYKHATSFSLKVKINPQKVGTVSKKSAGTTVALTAAPAYGYVFTGWSGASNFTINPLMITMDGNKVLTANFKLFEPRTVQIGNRLWMAENMNVMPSKPWCYYYTDDGIACIHGKSWCYDNDGRNCLKYGRLYDYYAAMMVCPAGWRLPTKDDWNSLIRASGYNIGKKLKSKTGWDDRECREYDHGYSREIDCPDSVRSGNGTDDFAFSALPGGEVKENYYGYVGKMGQWWTNLLDNEWYQLQNNRGGFENQWWANLDNEWYQLENNSDEFENVRCIGCGGSDGGKSVRCVQDIPSVPEKVGGK